MKVKIGFQYSLLDEYNTFLESKDEFYRLQENPTHQYQYFQCSRVEDSTPLIRPVIENTGFIAFGVIEIPDMEPALEKKFLQDLANQLNRQSKTTCPDFTSIAEKLAIKIMNEANAAKMISQQFGLLRCEEKPNSSDLVLAVEPPSIRLKA